ncbi:MAG: hemerythrin domain-containing protein [Alphaproteobacteria bacterium]
MTDPIAIIENEQMEFLKLCTALETIADALPRNIDLYQVNVATLFLRNSFADLLSVQEALLFPPLRQRTIAGDDCEAILSQIEREHEADRELAIEVADALLEINNRGYVANPEMLGYLLRCFFEGQRRHAAWERLTVYPLCRLRLTTADLAGITQKFAGKSRFVFPVTGQGV